jgi:hypothetical protein
VKRLAFVLLALILVAIVGSACSTTKVAAPVRAARERSGCPADETDDTCSTEHRVDVAATTPTTAPAPDTTIPAVTTTTTGGGSQGGYLANLCISSADFCGMSGSESHGAVQYGETICTSLKHGAPVKDVVAAEKVVAANTGLSHIDAVVIVESAVDYLCPHYLPALEAYANSPN